MELCTLLAARRRWFGPFLAAALFGVAAPAAALTCTWTGGTGNWSDPLKWTGCVGGVPGAGDTAVIGGGTATADVVVTVAGLTLSGAGGVNGAQPITVTQTLTWNAGSDIAGTALADSFVLDTGATGTITSGAGSDLTNRTFINRGTLTINPGMRMLGDSRLVNEGTINVGAATNYGVESVGIGTRSMSFAAGSTLVKSGSGEFQQRVPFSLAGTIEIQQGIYAILVANCQLDAGAAITGAGILRHASGGAFVIAGDASIARLRQENGPINGAGTLTITGNLDWVNSTFGGTDPALRVIVAAGATATTGAGGGGIFLNVSDGTFVNRGTFAMQAGVRLLGSGRFLNEGTLTFNAQSSGITEVAGAGTRLLTNAAGATLAKPAANTFVNTIGTPLDNAGTLDVDAGTLQVSGGGNATGLHDIAAGALLNYTSSTMVIGSGATFIGAGLVQAGSGNTWRADADVMIPNLQISGGVVTGAGRISVAQTFAWLAGNIRGTGPAQIFELLPGCAGSTGTGGPFLFDDLRSRTFLNRGTMTMGPMGIRHFDDARSVNEGTWVFPTGAGLSNDGGMGSRSLTNAATGTVTKSGGNPSVVSIAYQGSGAIDVTGGTLNFSGGGAGDSGSHAIAAGGALIYGGGTHVVGAGAAYTGAGALQVNAGVVRFDADVAIENLVLNAGEVRGAGTPTVGASLVWNNGTIGGDGAAQELVIGVGATATTGPGGQFAFDSLDNRTLRNRGTFSMGVQNIRSFDDARYANEGTWLFPVQGGISNDGGTGTRRFDNLAGATLTKSGGLGAAIQVDVNNAGTIEVQQATLNVGPFVQTGGSTRVAAGAVLLRNGNLALDGGVLGGSGTVQATVLNNAGTVAPGFSAGTLSITGSYTQAAAGTLAIEIGGTTAGTQYDRLAVSASATLAGTVQFTLIEGFAPTSADAFTFLTAAARSGLFAVNENAIAATHFISYAPTAATLTASGSNGVMSFPSCARQGFEGGAVVLPVTRSGGLDQASVGFVTMPVNATPGSDYTPTSGTLLWNGGEIGAKTIVIDLPEDGLVEPAEEFVVMLQGPSAGITFGAFDEVLVRILQGADGVFGDGFEEACLP